MNYRPTWVLSRYFSLEVFVTAGAQRFVDKPEPLPASRTFRGWRLEEIAAPEVLHAPKMFGGARRRIRKASEAARFVPREPKAGQSRSLPPSPGRPVHGCAETGRHPAERVRGCLHPDSRPVALHCASRAGAAPGGAGCGLPWPCRWPK